MANETRVLVSPGVFTREFDESFLPAEPEGIGAAVVGTRVQGPAMEPVKLRDPDQDQVIFGSPNSDGKDFAAYASRTYLKQNLAPLTFLRVLGMSDTGVVPGWNSAGINGGLFGIGASGSNVIALIYSSGAVTLQGTLTSSVDKLAIGVEGTASVTASLNRSDSNYIKKVLNTDPTQFSTRKHFVYSVFDYAYKTPNATNAFFAAKVPGGEDWTDDFVTGSTTNVISQPFDASEYELFGFGNRFAGASANVSHKVSITNIKKSNNPSINEYGTFNVLVRKYDDNDRNPVVLESFPNCTLNPDDDNFVAKRIGDRYRVWNKSTKKFDEFGDYPNKSNYVYIIPASALKNKTIPATSLPWGFKGYRNLLSGAVSNKAPFPEVPYVQNSLYKGQFNTRVYWGAEIVLNASGAINHGVADRIQHLNAALSTASGSVGTTFSLKHLSGSTQNISGYAPGTRLTDVNFGLLSTSLSYSVTGFTSGGTGGWLSVDNLENTVVAKFTLPLWDGFDGVDVTKTNPFDPANMGSSTTYEAYAYRTAIDMLENPELVEINLLSLPGVWANNVVDHAANMVDDRKDLLYILDLSGSTVDDVIANLDTKNLDTNYAATYYPWLRYRDEVNRKDVEVPPSAILPAVIAFTDKVSFSWFAPAGMNRGGLSQFGVTEAKDKLTKAERDRLYDSRINPIATQRKAAVVWGQKTLQLRQSALDRINVRRLLITIRKEAANIGATLVFEPNVASTWQKFTNRYQPFLERVMENAGIADFKIVLDERTTTEDLIERNIMFGKIGIKPTRTAEFFWLDFHVTNTLASFEEI